MDTSNKGEILEHSRTDQIISKNFSNFIYPSILQENSYFLAKKRRNRFIIPLKYDKEQEKELISSFAISMEIPINGIFLQNNSILAFFDDTRYRRVNSGIIQYGIIEIESIIKKEDLLEDQGIKQFPEYYTLIVSRGITIKYIAFNLPAKEQYEEPNVEIELDEYRSYGRSKRSCLETSK